MEYKLLDYVAIGQRIQAYRKGLTTLVDPVGKYMKPSQENLLAYMRDNGMPTFGRNTLSSLENGEKKAFLAVSMAQWDALCQVFGCSIGHLLGEYTCHDFSTQYIQDELGLSEKAIEKLRDISKWNRRSAHSDVISSLLESENCQFLLSMIGQSISYCLNESDMSQTFEARIDGINVSLFRGTLVNSMIQTHILEEIQSVSEIYKKNYSATPNAREREYAKFHNALVSKLSLEEITSSEFEKLETEWLKEETDNGKHPGKDK